MIALLALALAQVGIGIDRVPALPRATASPSPKPSASATLAPSAPSACAHAADVAIDSATQEKVDASGGIDSYVIHVSIVNRGVASQGKKTRQLIAVYRNEERIARMHVPPLEAGEAYAFTTKFKRSSQAGAGSTTLLFRLGGETYAPRSVEDCDDRDNSFRLTF